MPLSSFHESRLRQYAKDEAAYKNLLELMRGMATDYEGQLESLREQEAKYRQLFELESDAIFLIDNETGQILDVNQAATMMYGYSRDELLQLKNTDLSAEPDETRRIVREQHSLVPIRYHRRRSGEVFTVEITGRFFTWKGRPSHIAAMRDITERLKAETALRESEERYRILVNLLPNGVVIHRNGIIFFANPAAARILKVTDLQAIIGLPVLDFVHPDYRDMVLARIKRIVEHNAEAEPAEEKFIGQDGSPIDVKVAAVPFPYQGETAVMVVFEDITERKKAEQQAFVLAIERERLHVLRNFIQDASHEFRTPLSVINTSLYLLQRSQDPERKHRHEATILEQVELLTRLLDDMLLMTLLDSGDPFAFAPIDLNHLLTTTIAGLQESLPRQEHTLRLELDGRLPLICGDDAKLRRTFLNLLDNALRYTPAGGIIIVRTRLKGDSVITEIEDNGPGIARELQPQIFKRFFRQDKAHTTPGFGLGLPIAGQIVHKHGGHIELESTAGAGSLFRVQLPIYNCEK